VTGPIRLTIEEVHQDGCTDNLDGSDFYADVNVAGQAQRFGKIDDEDDLVNPSGWTLEKIVDVNAMPTATVSIDLWEFDGFFNFEDDHCDINPASGLPLTMSVPLIGCTVTGDATGACNTTITSKGNDEGDGDAEIKFRIEVDEPSSAPGITVRCTHEPLWPKPGDDVTIKVESLDGAVQVADGVDHSKVADAVEVWVTERTGPDLNLPNRSNAEHIVNDVPAGDLLYGCRVRDDGASVFTGWRRTRVGPPQEGKAIPVLYTGDRKSRVDIVFVADTDSYSAADDSDFLEDAGDVIRDAYYGQIDFLENQDKINFWLADTVGDMDRVPNPADPPNPICMLTPPSNFATDYSWRDAGAILHTDVLRDCANNRLFSSEPTSLAVVLHETGHQPFGMADEYCCDGGYFENPPNPNLWDSLAECQSDAPDLGRVAGDCRTFTDTGGTDWMLSDPAANDLMNDNGLPQAGDLRRMNWFYGNCVAEKC